MIVGKTSNLYNNEKRIKNKGKNLLELEVFDIKLNKIGIFIFNDEREHAYRETNAINLEIIKKWKEIIESNVRYKDGSYPEVILGSKVITSPRLAREVGEELVRAGVQILISCHNTWTYPYDIHPILNTLGKDKPLLQLSNNEGAFPGNVSLLAQDGALRQIGVKTHRVVGGMDDNDTRQKLFSWIYAAEAYSCMKNQVYASYGEMSMGMETGRFHLIPTIKTLGVALRSQDQLLLLEKAKEVDETEVKKAREWFEEMLGDRLKYDGNALTPEKLETQIKIYLAMKARNEEMGFDFCGIKGQIELSTWHCIADVAEMIAQDPYDWNGPKEVMVCSTEADSYAAITMQILKYISGGLPSLFMDVRLYIPELDVWDLCNSGEHSSWYANQSDDPRENFKKITFHPALSMYFPGGGASVEFDAKPGELTFCRLAVWEDQLYMIIILGDALDFSEEKRKEINEMTSPTWPHVHAKFKCSYEEFLNNFPCNHALAIPGNKLRELNYYCEISGVTPVLLGEAKNQRAVPIWETLGK